ncbi:MAG: hypothetical protein IJT07_02565 [Oscillospiraceae bacterium]|nr:hypothetical protein [Oscillospiraceae bacterium]
MRQSVVFLPQNDSQIKHIFTNKDGHLPDTPENRQLIFDLANDSSKFVGIDAYGTSWHAVINADGTQTWVRYYNKTRIISDAGQNQKPFAWNDRTGFNIEPKQWRKNHE